MAATTPPGNGPRPFRSVEVGADAVGNASGVREKADGEVRAVPTAHDDIDIRFVPEGRAPLLGLDHPERLRGGSLQLNIDRREETAVELDVEEAADDERAYAQYEYIPGGDS